MRIGEISEVVHDRATAINLLRAAVAIERGYRPRQHRRRAPKPVTAPVKPAQRPQSRRAGKCNCGHCRLCVENARWDRVYYEKFADLDYYNGVRVWNQSPLAGL